MSITAPATMLGAFVRTGRRVIEHLDTLGCAVHLRRPGMRRRIRERHRAFWTAPDADEIIRTVLHATDPLERWRQGTHWQRRLSNKANAREFAQLNGCPVPALYWSGADPAQIDFAALPANYVIRPTFGHSCHGVFVLREGVNLMDGTRHTPASLRAALEEARAANPHVHFLVEEFVRSETGEYRIPSDYKFQMFNGEIGCVQVIHRLGPSAGTTRFYDADWGPIAPISDMYPPSPYEPPPRCFEEMKEHARQLSRVYEIFVRLDFYATDRGAVFGEFTPTPGRGHGYTPFGDRAMAAYWDRYCPGMI